MHGHIPPLESLLFLFSLFCSALSQGLTDAQINIVKQRLQEGATHSWEIGTRAQALLELSIQSFSSLTPSPSSLLERPSMNATLADIYTIARTAVAALPSPPTNGSGQPLFLGDTSAGDPPSVGIAVLIANWTDFQSGQQRGGYDYAGAAMAQVDYLFGPDVPKTSDGAISHRVSQLQLWSDSVYMVPPFLAYYGMATNNQSMLQEAYTQIKLYRNYLSDPSANGLWQHIVLGSSENDSGHWSTGNAWAAAGMLRVLGTLKRSAYAQIFENEINDLGSWVSEIHSGMYPYLQPNGLFKNYADGFNSSNNRNNNSNFDDASSSALLAATVYHLALLMGNKTFIPQAELTRAALFATNGTSAPSSPSPTSPSFSPSPSPSPSSSSPPSTSTSYPLSSSSSSTSSSSPYPSYSSNSSSAFTHTPHFTTAGWLSPVVDPLKISFEGSQSPEGQAFALMLHAAWRDWNAVGSASRSHSPSATSFGRRSITFPADLGIWNSRCDAGLVLAVVGVAVTCTFLGDLLV